MRDTEIDHWHMTGYAALEYLEKRLLKQMLRPKGRAERDVVRQVAWRICGLYTAMAERQCQDPEGLGPDDVIAFWRAIKALSPKVLFSLADQIFPHGKLGRARLIEMCLRSAPVREARECPTDLNTS